MSDLKRDFSLSLEMTDVVRNYWLKYKYNYAKIQSYRY